MHLNLSSVFCWQKLKKGSENMLTKEKPRFLRDDVAGIILTDNSLHEYLERIVSSALNIDLELVKDNLVLKSSRINTNINVKYSEVDAIYESDDIIINIEVNFSKQLTTNTKNMRYVCHLVLEQIPIGKRKEYNLKPIYQININYYDIFNAGKFIYRSYIMEETLHQIRDNFFTIIDISMDFLANIDYNKIIKEAPDSLERLLYIFVCDNKDKLDSVYVGDEIMEKVRNKLSALTENFMEGLYYDREEYINQVSYEEGKTAGIEENKIKIAQNLLKENISIDIISKTTGLTIEEIKKLKKD